MPHEDESSVFTVVVYLNSDFQGGGTRFLDENDKSEPLLLLYMMKSMNHNSLSCEEQIGLDDNDV